MADIDIVLERLVNDTSFRAALADDPAAALAAYDLSEPDLQLLAGSLDDGGDAQRGVEQRTSKSAMVGLLASLTGGGQVAQDGRVRVTNAGGNLDPSPATKYSSPINVTSSTTIRTTAGPSPTAGLTGRPVGQPSAAGLGAHVRVAGSDLPALDGAAKDSASMGQDAPPDDTVGQHRDRPMAGEISVSRSVSAGGGEADQLAPPGANRAQPPWGGGPKHTPARADDLAPPPSTPAEEFVTHDIKNTHDYGQGAGLFAPKGIDDDGGFLTVEDD